MNEIILTLTFFLALLLTIYGTPIIQKVAHQYNLLDRPDGKLKVHQGPVPYMGGVIIYFSFIAPVSLLFEFSQYLLGILFAGSILLIVGLFDDLKALNPWIKFFFQIVATYVLIKSGIIINLIFLPLWLNHFLSFLYILTLINAFNFIDIIDGFAASIGLLSAITIFIISLYTQHFIISILSLSLAASLLGFLKFNWQPAKIYLGDAGSMFLGLVIGALTLMGSYTLYNDLAFFSAFLIPAIPLFDLVFVVILRILKGRHPFIGSPDHFALRLQKKFRLNSARTVSFIIVLQLILSTLVIINFYTNPTITIVSTVAILLFFSIFGLWLAEVKME